MIKNKRLQKLKMSTTKQINQKITLFKKVPKKQNVKVQQKTIFQKIALLKKVPKKTELQNMHLTLLTQIKIYQIS